MVRNVTKTMIATATLLGLAASSDAATYVYRGKPQTIEAVPAAPAVPAGPRRYAVADMGIATPDLRSAVAAGTGAQADWIKCSYSTTVFGDEPCDGGSQILVLFTASGSGKQFGLVARSDITKLSQNADVGGFYFSDAVPAKGYVFDRVGTNSTAGTISTSRAFSSPMYFLYGTAITGYASSGDWKTGYTLTGGASGTPVPGTPNWYKRVSP